MDQYSQDDGLENSPRRQIGPSTHGGATSAVSHLAGSPEANRNASSSPDGDHHPRRGSSPQYRDLGYQHQTLQTADAGRGPTDESNGQAYGGSHGELVVPPLNVRKGVEAKPAGSPSEGFKPRERDARPEPISSPLTHPNGVSMFPELSASEQEELSWEALDQAEESIIADSADSVDSRTDDGSDAGYDSDGVSSASTSAMSSVRDYMFENGRRYHRFREGSYNFPNDDVEQEREDMKHIMVKLLCSQKLHFAPIGDNPQEILDIGTGTGTWPIEMGDKFPSAHILGIDLSPIQPDWLPPNVRFMVDDVESPWLHPRNHFDYIHSRHTVMAVRDWVKLFRRAMEHLKIGGWIELQEIHHTPRSALPDGDGQLPPDHPVARFWKHVTDGLAVLGIDLDTAANGRLADMMRRAGFTNVTERVLHVPIGIWPKNKILKTVGLYWRTILLDGLQAIALGPLMRGLGWNREQVELLLVEVRRAYFDNAPLMYMPFHIIYAQRP
ncbi:methyltransferase type 11 [Trichoderma cornu-damae]|uniref:Methyltransferase type 11 n=1 Tax=Trichoderma cornu-damae TaxID=654480 RepID=A0A9P8QEH9_9HYPO|nr:methyltransferase type 11 [Trichoderma cornu-damae]